MLRFRSFAIRLVLDFVYLAIRSSSRIDCTICPNLQRLHLQFFWLENDSGFAIRRDAIHTGRGPAAAYTLPASSAAIAQM